MIFTWDLIEHREPRVDLGRRNPREGYGPCQGDPDEVEEEPTQEEREDHLDWLTSLPPGARRDLREVA